MAESTRRDVSCRTLPATTRIEVQTSAARRRSGPLFCGLLLWTGVYTQVVVPKHTRGAERRNYCGSRGERWGVGWPDLLPVIREADSAVIFKTFRQLFFFPQPIYPCFRLPRVPPPLQLQPNQHCQHEPGLPLAADGCEGRGCSCSPCSPSKHHAVEIMTGYLVDILQHYQLSLLVDVADPRCLVYGQIIIHHKSSF